MTINTCKRFDEIARLTVTDTCIYIYENMRLSIWNSAGHFEMYTSNFVFNVGRERKGRIQIFRTRLVETCLSGVEAE